MTSEHFDIIIVGTGSGNSIPGVELHDKKIAIVERGVFGGTCINVGCIPTKMFVYAAEVAEIAAHVNERQENIGARRLHTVMERLLEEASFKGGDMDSPLVIDADYVNAQLGELAVDEDLSRYIL